MDGLYDWQRQAVDKFRRAVNPRRFLLAAFPGMGKTRCAVSILESTGRFGIILVPQADVVSHWRKWLHPHLPPAKVTTDGISQLCPCGCRRKARSAVMTYAFAAANPHILATIYRQHGPCLLICDEVHHLRRERSWSAAIISASPFIDMVLALSATPFRTDEEPVPFVHTEGPWSTEINLITEDYIAEYGYGAALTMDPPPVTRAVFERYDADVTWLEADIDGEVEKQATLSGEHAVEVARKARRHAIDARGDWLNRVLISADDKLVSLRADDPRAGGVIICRDTNHVVATANLLLGIGTEDIAVYTQDYATTSHRLGDGRILDNGTRSGHRPSQDVLSAYMDGTAKWILTVRKLSEGVDVPRLRVLVYATVVRTRLFFIQAVGRVVRVRWDLNVGVDQTAWIYIPDDPVTRGYATEIENLVADAEITAYEQDEDENTEGGLPERSSESSEVFDRFVSAEGEYAGMTSGGSAHDPQLAKLAAELGGSVVGNLDVLHKLSRLGLLNLTNDDPPPPDHDPVDPMVVFATKVKQKNQAVKAWASLRLRREDFPSYGDSIRSCNRDLGELFGVWAENRNVSADQVEKATQYAREQIKRLRGRG